MVLVSTHSIDLAAPVNWANPLNIGLEAWWLVMPGNCKGGVWVDITKHGHDGVLTNMNPASDWVGTNRPGGWGAIEFDRTDDAIVIPAPPAPGSIDMQGWKGLTVTAWVNWTAAGTAEHCVFSNWTAGGAPARVLFRLEPDPDIMELFLTCTGGGPSLTVSDLIIPRDTWTHLALIYDTSNGLRALMNGELSTNTAAALGTLQTTISETLHIGNTPHTTSDDYGGELDDVRVWSRGLSPDEVRQLYFDSMGG